MSAYEILKYGSQVLRTKAEKVENIDVEIREIASKMFQTMWSYDGIGLAANQVGIAKRIIVIDISHLDKNFTPTALINPEILDSEGDIIMEEGCLSVPGIYEEVKRAEKITVQFQSVDGSTNKWTCEGLLARVIQHEIDHLDGILFPDLIPSVKKKLLEGKLKDISRGIPVEKIKEKII
ncbi:peptide deformylase [candidate division KSB1 bacterium]